MNKTDEKIRIYSMMETITEERSKLTDMYLGLLRKLEVLDEYEREEVKEVKVEDDFLIHESIEPVHEKTLDEIIDEHNQKYNEVLEEPVVTHRVPKIEIERELDKLPRRRNTTMDAQKANMLVVSVLKEKGVPTSANEIFELFSEKTDIKIDIKNFRNNILPRVVKSNNRVERAMRGFYQYK